MEISCWLINFARALYDAEKFDFMRLSSSLEPMHSYLEKSAFLSRGKID